MKTKPLFSLVTRAFAPSQILFMGEPLCESRDAFFDPPGSERDVVGTVLAQAKGMWWTPRFVVSTASDSEAPAHSDPQIGHPGAWVNGVLQVPGEEPRASHDILVSNTFALHPMFGPGHIVRTNGTLAAFWTGEATYVVEVENLKPLRVVLSRAAGREGDKPRARKGSKAVLAALESLLSA